MKAKEYVEELNDAVEKEYGKEGEVLAAFTIIVDHNYNISTYGRTETDQIEDAVAMVASGMLVEASRIDLANNFLELKNRWPKEKFEQFIEIIKNDEYEELTLVDDALRYVKNYEERMKQQIDVN